MGLIEQIKRHEDAKHIPGADFRPFKDTTGHLTIGWGRNLDTVGISEHIAEMLLAEDIARAQANLLATYPMFVALDEVRLGVLVELTFNLGIGGLKGFKQLLNAVRAGDFKLAALHLLDSLYAKQVKSRAVELAKELQSGQWA